MALSNHSDNVGTCADVKKEMEIIQTSMAIAAEQTNQRYFEKRLKSVVPVAGLAMPLDADVVLEKWTLERIETLSWFVPRGDMYQRRTAICEKNQDERYILKKVVKNLRRLLNLNKI